MRVVGLDISLKGPGVCVVEGNPRSKCGEQLEAEAAKIRIGEDLRGPQRLAVVTESLVSWLHSRAALCPRQLFVMEGYAFGQAGAAHSLGEIGGCVRRELWAAGANLIVVPPSTLKKYVTGRGVGDKNIVMKVVYKRWGFDSDDDNECDAFGAAMLGLVDAALHKDEWQNAEREILLNKVERYAGKGQESWLGGAAPGKVAGSPRRRGRSRHVDQRSSIQ